jgi:hypothetical protein
MLHNKKLGGLLTSIVCSFDRVCTEGVLSPNPELKNATCPHLWCERSSNTTTAAAAPLKMYSTLGVQQSKVNGFS